MPTRRAPCARRLYGGSRWGLEQTEYERPWRRDSIRGIANLTPNSNSVGAAFDREALRAPAQHAAGQVGDFLEAGLAEDHGRLRRAGAGAAHRDDGLFLRQLCEPL